MQVGIESQLCTTLWTHQDRRDNGVFSLNLLNASGLNIVNIIIDCIYLYIVIVLIVYSFSMLVKIFAFYLDKKGENV